MYKDKALQRETTKLRVRRYRLHKGVTRSNEAKALHEGVTKKEGVTVTPLLEELRETIAGIVPKPNKTPIRTDVKDVLVDESGQRYKLIGGVRYAI